MVSYPFTSEVTYDDYGQPLYDRAVDSSFLRKVFSRYFSDGIFYKPTNALQVVLDTGMQVAVEPGACHIQGAMGIEESRRTLAVQAAEAQDRIDTVVARLDLSQAARSIDLYIVKGTAALSPQPPELTRDATRWELGLANLFIAKNSSSITQQRITDTRLDTSRCGIVSQTIGEMDTAPYFAQLAAAISAHQQDAEAQIEALRAAIAAVEGDTAWMLKSTYDSKNRNQDVYDYGIHLYKSTLLLNAWQGEGPYTQTAALTPLDGGPAVTPDSVFCTGPLGTQTGEEATNRTLAANLTCLNGGTVVCGQGSVTATVFQKPDADLEVFWQMRKGGI